MKRHVVQSRLLLSQRILSLLALSNIGTNRTDTKNFILLILKREFHHPIDVHTSILVLHL